MPTNNYIDIMEKNHMEIPWHDYTGDDSNTLIKESGLIEKASVIGSWFNYAFLWHRCMACKNFNEQTFKGTSCYMYS